MPETNRHHAGRLQMIREIGKMSATATAGQPIGGTRRKLPYLVRLPLFPGNRARPNWKKGKPKGAM
jgi:hypothetical protein